jgi:NitT/TauT family transport system substrate-binding protein
MRRLLIEGAAMTNARIMIVIMAILVSCVPTNVRAESTELRVAEQFGIAYLPFLVMRKDHLIEKHLGKAGLSNVDVKWVKFGGGSSMNDALISGSLDFAAAGISAFLSLWNKTANNASDVSIVAGFNNIPVFLNTVDPRIRSIKDFRDGDKIALPAVKVSLQAMVLQMAAAKEWGQQNATRLDKFTVSMKHPDAMAAMLSHGSEIRNHFGSPPFMFQELDHPGVRTILDSSEVLGRHNFNVIYATKSFRKQNPHLYKAFIDALDDAMQVINADKRRAAQMYVDSVANKRESFDEIYKMVNNPAMEFTTVPNGLMKFASFMSGMGALTRKPGNWRDLCFPEAATKAGS